VWNFLCLECEIPKPGDYKTTFVGDTPIIVARAQDGTVSALVNRCAHKGALVCYKQRGNVQEFNCVYHNWTYDLKGGLTGVAFRKGVGGKGGVGPTQDRPTAANSHGPSEKTRARPTPITHPLAPVGSGDVGHGGVCGADLG
jgi:phenylpropionate dioxygenase-like ring-hydroxylating dioxygenase large terminal subunit